MVRRHSRGFFGSLVRGERFKLAVSEFDLILGVASDGTYRVMTPPEKVLFTGKLLHCAPFDPEQGFEFTLVYRDRARIPYGKRVCIERFIRNREYQLIKDKQGKLDLMLAPAETGVVTLSFAPAPRQRPCPHRGCRHGAGSQLLQSGYLSKKKGWHGQPGPPQHR